MAYPFDTSYDPYRPWLSYGSQPIEGPAGGSYQPSYFSTLYGQDQLPQVDPRLALQESPAMMRSAANPLALADVVKGEFGRQGSAIQSIYGAYGLDAATQDIQALLSGGKSVYGEIEGARQFGTRDLTQAQRQAFGAQMLGDVSSPVDLGFNQFFNPQSMDILSDYYQAGNPAMNPNSRLGIAAGMLGQYNLDINQGILGELQGSLGQGGAYGSKYSARITDALKGLQLGAGETIKTGASPLGQWIDNWYSGQKIFGQVGKQIGSWFEAGRTGAGA